MTMADYVVHYHPPVYPARCFPGRCTHEPQFVMQANVELPNRKAGRKQMEVDHMVCLACGKALPATYGGNVLVDLQMLWGSFGWNAQIGSRIIHLRNKWTRLATYLFDENGWNGRHEAVARLIDPNLTMKLKIESLPGGENRMGTVRYDASYLRPCADDEAAAA
jgi:hypothetical protein